jgi:RNA polymerase sigma factor (sigma-70 family)
MTPGRNLLGLEGRYPVMGEAATSTTSANLMTVLADPAASERLRRRLLDMAWFRYRIPSDRGEDVVQAAIATYLEVRDSYRHVPDHGALLAGILRKKCLEHIDRSVRENRKFRAYCADGDVARENPWVRPESPAQGPSVVEQIVKDEERRQIVAALAALGPTAREIVTLMTREGLTRKELIERLRLNKNTLDSRLHACRRELRGLLRKVGVHL